MNNKKLQELLEIFSKEWKGIASKASKLLLEELQKGTKLEKSVKKVRKEYPDLFKLPQTKDLVTAAAIESYGVSARLVTEAGTAAILKQLSKPWDGTGLTLSQKLHGAGAQMHSAIINTLETQIRANKSVIEIARALYDGYNANKIIQVQELPDYLKAFRHAMPGDANMLAQARKAGERIKALGRNGAPNQALATAYKQLLETATKGTEKALKNAVYVAINEKSRYVAERIARTEAAKAWADGFYTEALQDKHVVGFKWKLGSRHPVYDICDMYSRADIFNLGAGIYPKDQVPPLPAHPHCLCRVAKVYRGQIDLTKQQDNTDEAVNSWLKDLTDRQRQQVLGIKGVKEWNQGEGWQDKLRGWQGLTSPVSRLKPEFIRSLMEQNLFPPNDKFLQDLAKSQGWRYTLGKEGRNRFFSDDGWEIYPANSGVIGNIQFETLKMGSVITRYGENKGRFVSPNGTSFEERSLPKKTEFHRYRVIKDLPNVKSGRTCAWFGEPGGGWQYELPGRIKDLSEYLEEVGEK